MTHWKRPWFWERLRAGEEGDYREWDGWIVSPTQWIWVWVNSGSWWWTGRPGVLQSMERAGHNWVTELNRQLNIFLVMTLRIQNFWSSTGYLQGCIRGGEVQCREIQLWKVEETKEEERGELPVSRSIWKELKEIECVCLLTHSLLAFLWAVARQAPLSKGILQARILEWVATPSSRQMEYACHISKQRTSPFSSAITAL